MLKIHKSEFDSKIFGRNVYKLYIDHTLKRNDVIENLLSDKKVDILFCFSIFSNKNISLFEKMGFLFISIRTTYTLSLNHTSATIQLRPHKNISIVRQPSKGIRITEKDITSLARVLISTSRYSKDINIPSSLGREFFESWIKNSLFHNFADEAFLAVYKKKVIGLVSYKLKKDTAYLDLICVLPKFQNRGIGKLLLNKVLDRLKDKNISTLVTSTQGENIAANIFYQKNKFIIKNIELVYHKHFRRV